MWASDQVISVASFSATSVTCSSFPELCLSLVFSAEGSLSQTSVFIVLATDVNDFLRSKGDFPACSTLLK